MRTRDELLNLSIIIVSWNTKLLLKQCLASIYMYPPRIPFEVIVVDNASHDGSVQMLQDSFPQVILVENEENVGFARANNQAIRRSSSKFLLLLNPDAQVLPNTFSAMIGYMRRYDRVGILGIQLVFPNGSEQESWGYFPSLSNDLRQALKVLTPKHSNHASTTRAPHPVDWVKGACMLVRQKAISDVGLLDEAYFLYTEETDWCYRMWQADWEVHFLPQIGAIHHEHAATNQRHLEVFLIFHRSRFLFLQKHRGALETGLVKLVTGLKACIRLLQGARSPLARSAPLATTSDVRKTYLKLLRLCFGIPLR